MQTKEAVNDKIHQNTVYAFNGGFYDIYVYDFYRLYDFYCPCPYDHCVLYALIVFCADLRRRRRTSIRL